MSWEPRLSYWAIQTIAMVITIWIIPNLHLKGIISGFLVVATLAAINTFLWDATLFLALPQSFSMHAALLLLINGTIFWVVVKLLPGVECEGILPALIAPVVFSLCSILIRTYGPLVDWALVFAWLYDVLQNLFGWLKQVVASH